MLRSSFRARASQLSSSSLQPSSNSTPFNRLISSSGKTSISSTIPISPFDQSTTIPDLPSGRSLAYATYGSSSGLPLLFFHGYPSSRLEALPLSDLASRLGIRLVCIDRPGFGLSSPQPGRTILDWPDDVLDVTTHLKLSRFAVLGGSGGGPYALAMAHAFGKERVAACGLLASAPPWQAGTKDVARYRRIYSWLAYNTPTLLRLILDGTVRLTRWAVGTRYVQNWLDNLLETLRRKAKEQGNDSNLGEEDLNVAERRERMLAVIFEGFRQGSGAAVEEARLLSAKTWGFDFEDVKYDKVQIWHGEADTAASIKMIRWMAERIPNAELTVFEEGHFDLAGKLEGVIEELMEEARKNGLEGSGGSGSEGKQSVMAS